MFVPVLLFYQAIFLVFDGPNVDIHFLNTFVATDTKNFFLLYFPLNYVFFAFSKSRYYM